MLCHSGQIRLQKLATANSKTLYANLLRHFIFILIIFFTSCKLTEKNIIGHFNLNNGTNTYFDFDTTRHFSFIQCNPLKALLTNKSDFFMTQGVWKFNDSGYITLNSLKETETYKKVKVNKIEKADKSSFTFYDMNGDTLPIVGATKNGQWFGSISMHKLPKSFELTLSQGDTVTADLIGYDKFRFVYSDTSQSVYHVVLYPNYVVDYFKNKRLVLKRKRIIDLELKETYRK